MKKTIITLLLITILVSLPAITFAETTTEDPEFFLLKQGSTSYIVEAIQGEASAFDFYDYIPHSGRTPYMQEKVSKIYLYQADQAHGGKLSLIIHHNKLGFGPDWVDVNFDFYNLVGLEDVTTYSDDLSEFDLNNQPEGQWSYIGNSYGGYIEGLPETDWSITIQPEFNIGIEDPVDNYIVAWNYQNSPDEEVTDLIELDLTQPITITNVIDNLSPVDGVGLDFFDTLTGPGSIGVTKLGCASSGLPTALFDIQVTLGFDGNVEISMQHDGSQLSKGQEKKLRLWATQEIIPGDVNFDGIVDHKDIQSIKQAIRSWNEDPVDPNVNNNGHDNGWNPCCNVDGLIGVTEDDLTMALENLGEESLWFDITTFLDIDNDMIYGETDHFSIFRGR